MTEKKNFLLRETPLTRQRIDSERISSTPPLSLVVFHWRRSTLLWPLSKFVLALHPARPHALSHTQTHTHTQLLSCSLIPFQTSHHRRYYGCFSLSLWSHVLSLLAHFSVITPATFQSFLLLNLWPGKVSVCVSLCEERQSHSGPRWLTCCCSFSTLVCHLALGLCRHSFVQTISSKLLMFLLPVSSHLSIYLSSQQKVP